MFCPQVHGIEWDWFACDHDGHMALISSGGSGQVPPDMLVHEDAIRRLMQDLGIRCDRESWALAAERGLYGYDVDLRGGPFRRVASPRMPRVLQDLPEPHRTLIARAEVRGRFARLRRIDCSLVTYRADP